MCFSIIAGKLATNTGNVILGVNDDWPGCPGQVLYVERKEHSPTDKFLTVKGMKIPQVSTTFAYTFTAAAYETGTRGVSWPNGLNENQVAFSMQGVYAFRNCQTEKDVLEADDIAILILERATSARQAIHMVGELIEKYGYTVSTIEGAEGTVSMGIADPEEAFFLELVPGGHWVAKRVADDHVECRPNCFGTQEVNFEDERNYIVSPKLKEYAINQGLYIEGKPFNFTEIYGEGEFLNESYAGKYNPMNMGRRWSTLYLTADMDTELEEQIYEAPASKKLSKEDIMDILRDSMEGTKHDLSQMPEAGSFHNPFWMEHSNSIGQAGTVISTVVEMKKDLPENIGACMWIACANSHLSIFVPCYVNVGGLPEAYTKGELGDFNLDSAWWAFHEAGELCYRNYDEIARKEVIPAFRAFEKQIIEEQKVIEEKVMNLNLEDAKNEIKRYSHERAQEAYELALKMGHKIKGKYLSNTILSWL